LVGWGIYIYINIYTFGSTPERSNLWAGWLGGVYMYIYIYIYRGLKREKCNLWDEGRVTPGIALVFSTQALYAATRFYIRVYIYIYISVWLDPREIESLGGLA